MFPVDRPIFDPTTTACGSQLVPASNPKFPKNPNFQLPIESSSRFHALLDHPDEIIRGPIIVSVFLTLVLTGKCYDLP